MLKVENLTKQYNKVTAVKDLSFSIEKGTIFGLLGPNGAGKTTTIRSVLNIIKPNSGKITFDDKPITQEFFNIIGYLPEERGLYQKSKVLDVIMYFAELKSMQRTEANERAIKWLRVLEMDSYGSRKVEELSKGNQQKVQFICSVIHDPKLLILDEPFSGFDPINQQHIKELVLSLATSGKIIILSTHQMDTAEKMCGEILLLNRGKEVCSGTLPQIRKRYGSNNIKIEFEGNPDFLKTHPSVISYNNYGNYAEIQLKESTVPYEFLKTIIDKIKLSHFSVVEPTLNKIFIDVVRENKE
jgi:ABC-2 type transport system ATP-binding protein